MARLKPLTVEQIERLFTKDVRSRGLEFSMRTKGKDLGFEKGTKNIEAVIKNAPLVKIGVQSSAGNYPNAGPHVAEVAFWMEHGVESKNIPARPFMQVTMDADRRKFSNTTDKLIGAIQAGKLNPIIALNLIGAQIARAMQRRLTITKWAPNAPATVRRKGSSRPLIDTGRLRRSITWEVEE